MADQATEQELPVEPGSGGSAGELADQQAEVELSEIDALVDAPETGGAVPPPLALYRRYRPDTFADLIGQEHVTEPLQRALENNRVHHAYLFSGPRGCGKTTSARILARALNCAQGPVAEPCGACQSCQDLATGGSGSIDVIEIDAASHGGVDDARDLRERAFFAPVNSRYKIYVIDEAHMVTSAGFNALLRLVEEPPPHVKFVFATTEPDKVIGTIRSRTHHYPFRLVPPRLLQDFLASVCTSEGIEVENGVLPLVVRAGAGSVRDSLSVLDQLLGGASGNGVSYRQAAALLGYTPDSLLDEMLDAVAAGDSAGVFRSVDKVIEVGQDPRRFAEDLLRRVRDLVIVASVPDALSSGLLDVADDQAERLSSQAATLGVGELTRAGEVLATGLTQMRGTTAPRLHLELMCARVLLPATDVDDRGVHARLDRIERRMGMMGPAAESGPDLARSAAAQAVQSTDTAAASPSPTSSEAGGGWPAANDPDRQVEGPGGQQEQRQHGEPEQPQPEPSPPQPAPVNKEPSAQRATPTQRETPTQPEARTRQPGASSDLTITDLRRLWPEVLEAVKNRRRFTWILLSQNAQVADFANGTLMLAMPNTGARDSFARGGSEEILKEALIAVIGADLQIETMVDPSAGGGRGGGSSSAPPSGGQPSPTGASTGSPSDRPAGDVPDPNGSPDGQPDPSRQPAGAAESPGVDGDATLTADPAPDDAQSAAAALDHAAPGGEPRPANPSAVRGEHASPAGSPPWEPPATSSNDGSDATRKTEDARQSSPTPSADWAMRDAAAHRTDETVADGGESHTELLQRRLGAEVIAEEGPGA